MTEFLPLELRSPSGLGTEHPIGRVTWVEGRVELRVFDPGYRPLLEKLFLRDFDGRVGSPPGRRVCARYGTREAFAAGLEALTDRRIGRSPKPAVTAQLGSERAPSPSTPTFTLGRAKPRLQMEVG